MADRPDGRGSSITDGDVIDQLRAYADALADRGPVTVLGTAGPGQDQGQDRRQDPNQGSRQRRPIVLAAAVVLAVALGSWSLWRSAGPSTDAVDTTDRSSTTTSTPVEDDGTDGDEETGLDRLDAGAGYLLPDPDRWAVVAHYGEDDELDASTGAPNGVWAWRADGVLHILIEGFHAEDLGPLPDAEPVAEAGRATIGWRADDGRSFGLQSIGGDGDAAQRTASLRSVALALEPVDDGWGLSGAEVLTDEAAPPRPDSHEQIDLAPVDDAGVAGLRGSVTVSTRTSSVASLYQELFEASSLGIVTETTIGGQPGFLITGEFASYALTHGQGRTTSWQTSDGAVDLAALVATVRPVDEDAWQDAIASIDATIDEAMAAAVAAESASDRPIDPAPTVDLPRLRLPEPWQLAWVTDLGLWSEEDWAKRRALERANTPEGIGDYELLRTQGFRRTGQGPAPVPFPEIIIRVSRPVAPSLSDLAMSDDASEITVAGLEGRLERVLFSTGEEILVYAIGDDAGLEISAPGLSEAEVEAFVATLSQRSPDLADGFDSDRSRYEPVVDLVGEAGNGSTTATRWLATYAHPDDPDPDDPGTGGPRIQVQALDDQQLRLALAPFTGQPVPSYDVVDGGRFLIDSDGLFRSLLRYDPDADILTSVSWPGASVDELIELYDSLEPVELERWRELVAPYNADPVRPR